MATAGVCLYCGVTDEHVDGNKLSWRDASRICCSKYSCVTAHYAAAKKAARAARPAQPKSFRQRVAELTGQGYGYGLACATARREERQRLRARKRRAA